MNNRVILANPKKQKLIGAAVICLIFCVMFIIAAWTIADIGKKNLNGITSTVTGVVEKIYDEEGVLVAVIDGKEYTTSIIENYYESEDTSFADYVNSLVGKTVRVVTPQQHVGDVRPWVVGLYCDGETLFDEEEIIPQQKAENKVTLNVMIAICAVCAAAFIALVIAVINTQPTKEFALTQKYCDFSLERLPSLPAFKNSGWTVIPLFVTLLCCAIAWILMGVYDAPDSVWIIVTVATLVLYAAVIALMIIVRRKYVKKSRKFYAENFPFDLTDISHLSIRKDIKEELQQELVEERRRFPHRHGDGGNGYDVEFTAEGLVLREPNFDEPSAFDEMQPENPPIMTLKYDELNLKAVAFYYPAERPMAIVIKSRLERKDYFPEEFENDLHFFADVHLLNSIRTFGVKVENLDYLLENKEKLMAENCPKSKKAELPHRPY